ncbi:hypothetical protein [Azospirillum sp.]|uniref:hypothetical protein n=1 Tax=Azospirillum sp. TaxID=34012 RepID=UPI002D4F774A|nr:hypothetical protein [Azospirillum sp.]HYD66300.1 hypothetical protein [Azospirillum sp.]
MPEAVEPQEPDYSILDRRISRALEQRGVESGIVTGDGGGHIGGMSDRVSKLEGAMDGVKHAQTSLLAVVSIVGGVALAVVALIATLQIFTLTEIGGIEDTIREEFRALRAESAAQTSAIANAVTATKQQAPQVILVPGPYPAPAQQ